MAVIKVILKKTEVGISISIIFIIIEKIKNKDACKVKVIDGCLLMINRLKNNFNFSIQIRQ